jgi:general L-amino acid transport system permease protein
MAIRSPASKSSVTPQVRWYYDSAIRAYFFQGLVALAVAGALFYIISNTLHNMHARGIASGFEFLSHRAGFGIIQSLIPYDESYSYGRTFLVGLVNTLVVSALGIILATLLGFLLGVARLSRNWLVSKVATLYVETFRNIPLLLQIFFWYFAVLRTLPSPKQSLNWGDAIFLNIRGLSMPAPVFNEGIGFVMAALGIALIASGVLLRWAKKRRLATGVQYPAGWIALGAVIGLPMLTFFIAGRPMDVDLPHLQGFNFKGGMTIIPELAALLMALTIYTAAFIAEIVRSGINAVSKGQTEAAHALSLSQGQTLRLVVIPQALRVIIPPLTSQYLNLTKNSSLATAIGYPDLVSVFMGTTLNQTGQAIEVTAMTMAVYLTISIATSFLMNSYNRRMALVER